MNTILHKTGDQFTLKSEKGETIAITMTEAPLKEGVFLSLKNCQAIKLGYDLDELLKKEIADGKLHPNDGAKKEGITRGIELALEILGDKKFREEDMVKFMQFIVSNKELENTSSVHKSTAKHYVDKFFALDSMNKWEVEIVQVPAKEDCGPGETNWMNPKLDKEGKLILKRKQ